MASEVRLTLPTSGVHREINPAYLPADALRDADNWLYRDGEFRTRPGFVPYGDASAVITRPMGFTSYLSAVDKLQRIVMATAAQWYRLAAGNVWTAITGTGLPATLTATRDNQTIFREFHQAIGGTDTSTTMLIGINGIDAPQRWAGAGGDARVALAVSGGGAAAPPIPKAMMVLANRVLFGNIVSRNGNTSSMISPVVVDVSAFNDPTTGWGTTEVALLADTPGEIVSMNEMGNLQGAIYKADAIYMAIAQGSVDPFSFPLKQANVVGPASPLSAVVVTDGLHIYLARDGSVMKFDGVQAVPLPRNVQKYFVDNFNPDFGQSAFGVYDAPNQEVCFYFVGTDASDVNREVKIRLDNMSVWPQRFGTRLFSAALRIKSSVAYESIGQQVGTYAANAGKTLGSTVSRGAAFLAGDIAGPPFTEQDKTSDGASPVSCFFEAGQNDLGSPGTWKTLQEMDHEFRTAASPQTVSFKVAAADYGEAADFVPVVAETVDPGAAEWHTTGHRTTGRRFAVRVESSATDKISYQGSTASVAMRGDR